MKVESENIIITLTNEEARNLLDDLKGAREANLIYDSTNDLIAMLEERL